MRPATFDRDATAYLSPPRQNRPRRLPCVSPQRGVGIHRVWPRHLLQQRQVVARVGVETRTIEVFVAGAQPLVKSNDLALAIGQRAARTARVRSVVRRQFDRNRAAIGRTR
jgi:hypothetical protein